LIDSITIFGEFAGLFKRALSGKVMEVLGDSKQDNNYQYAAGEYY
jgi:hypothetical protein